jgi:hypothetical protein
MKSRIILSLAGGLLLAVSLIPSSAQAASLVSNQATEVTFQQPVRIPGTVLPPGTYWFTVPTGGVSSGLNRVMVTTADGKPLAQMVTQTSDLAQFGQRDVHANGVVWPSGKIVMTFAQGTNGQPATLLDWYYAGRTDGHRFVYSNNRERQLSEENHETLAFTSGNTISIGKGQATLE